MSHYWNVTAQNFNLHNYACTEQLERLPFYINAPLLIKVIHHDSSSQTHHINCQIKRENGRQRERENHWLSLHLLKSTLRPDFSTWFALWSGFLVQRSVGNSGKVKRLNAWIPYGSYHNFHFLFGPHPACFPISRYLAEDALLLLHLQRLQKIENLMLPRQHYFKPLKGFWYKML